MANPWFRMYSEFSHDPKVQMMSEVMQRRYIMIMCLRCSNELVTLHETEIAFHLRITDDELAETKALFIAKGFIDEQWSLLNWEKRQFKSDSSAERVSRHRANKKAASNGDVTLQKRKSNALDTDTDTDNKNHSASVPDDGFDLFWKAYPKKKSRGDALKAWRKLKSKRETLALIQSALAWQTKTQDWTKDGGQFIPYPASYLNSQGWLDAPTTGEPVTQAMTREDAEAKRREQLAAARAAHLAQEAA